MAWTKLRVGGLRGFARDQTLELALPDGNVGSGLTILVGANNAGKSTVLEALRALGSRTALSFSEGKRNKVYGDRISIALISDTGAVVEIESFRAGGSEMRSKSTSNEWPDVYTVPSRRAFSSSFGDYTSQSDRRSYTQHGLAQVQVRAASIDQFSGRLMRVARDPELRARFDGLLGKVLSPLPEWTIDQNESGNYFVKFLWPQRGLGASHTSDGLGEGLLSLLFIVDSLYDADPGAIVVVDEPELSLHPQLQRRTAELFSSLSHKLQIVISTHSPYFVRWNDVAQGARVARVFTSAEGSQIAQPSAETISTVARLATDQNNPHTLGLNANEVFFLEEAVLLVEGQEDVIRLPKAFQTLGVVLNATFFGWGVGGAEKMGHICELLREMKFFRVVGILDSDKSNVAAALKANFPEFLFECIPAPDVRSKPAMAAKDAKIGLTGSGGTVRPEYIEETKQLLGRVQSYLNSDVAISCQD